eukprot:Opistho-2@44316
MAIPNRRRTGIILIVLGVGALALGFGIGFGLPTVVFKTVDRMVQWPSYDGDSGYLDWLNNDDVDDVPYYQYIYLFNITNPQAFLYGGQAPVMAEVGPYVYRYIKRKFDVAWPTDDTVSFKEYGFQVFDASLSFAGAKPTQDQIFQINIIYTRALTSLRLLSVMSGVLASRIAQSTAPTACNGITPATVPTSPACQLALRQLPEFGPSVAATDADQVLFVYMAASITANVLTAIDNVMPSVLTSAFVASIPSTTVSNIVGASGGGALITAATTVLAGSSGATKAAYDAACTTINSIKCYNAIYSLNPTIDCAGLPDVSPECPGGGVTTTAFRVAATAFHYRTIIAPSMQFTWATWQAVLGLPSFANTNSYLYGYDTPTGVPSGTGIWKWADQNQIPNLAGGFSLNGTQATQMVTVLLQPTFNAIQSNYFTGMQTFYGSPPASNNFAYPTTIATATKRQLSLYQFGAGGAAGGGGQSLVNMTSWAAIRTGLAAQGVVLPFPPGFNNLELFSFAKQVYTFPSELSAGTISPLTLNDTLKIYSVLTASSPLGSFLSTASALRTQAATVSSMANPAVAAAVKAGGNGAVVGDILPIALPAAAFYVSTVKTETGTPAACTACDVGGVLCAANTYATNSNTAACFEWAQAQADFATRAVNNASSPANGDASALNALKTACGGFLAGSVSASLASTNPVTQGTCLVYLYTTYQSRFTALDAIMTACGIPSVPQLTRYLARGLFGDTTTVRDACVNAINATALTSVNAVRKAISDATALFSTTVNFDLASWTHGGSFSTYENARVNIEIFAGYALASQMPMVAQYFDGQNKGLVVRHSAADFALGGFTDDFYVSLTQGLSGPTPGFTTNYSSLAAATQFAPKYTYNIGKFDRGLVGNYYAKDGSRTIASTYYPNITASRPDLLLYRGSDGTQFHPAKRQNVLLDFDTPYASAYEVWVTQVSRTVPLARDDNYKIEGILLNRFRLKQTALNNTDAINKLYGVTLSGTQPVSNDRGFLSYVSLPRFLHGEPSLLALYPNIVPNGDLHDSYLGIEPITGATMQARKRLQGNLGIECRYWSPAFSGTYMRYNISKTYCNVPVPYYWIGEQSEINRHKANEFKKKVYGAAKAGVAAIVIGVVTGVVMLTVGAVLLIKHKQSSKVMTVDHSGPNDVHMEPVQFNDDAAGGAHPTTNANAWA